MLEKEIEKRVCEYAKSKGFEVYKFSSPNRVGVPDRMFVGLMQVLFFIEFKREGGKPTAMQTREAEKLASRGFMVYLVDSVEQGINTIDAEHSRVEALKGMFSIFSGSEDEVKH